ncbi:serine threonine protein [Colletotrichum higginsianum]|nr:serine threonine protein [Colletotrichum higginsianum]
MSLVFGRKDVVSKSWSDMWDEDEEEEEAEAERERQMQSLKDLNSRTWSHDSKLDDQDDCDTVDATPIATTPQRSHHDSHKLIHNDIDSDHATDGFFFQQSSPPKPKPMVTTSQSPLSGTISTNGLPWVSVVAGSQARYTRKCHPSFLDKKQSD